MAATADIFIFCDIYVWSKIKLATSVLEITYFQHGQKKPVF